MSNNPPAIPIALRRPPSVVAKRGAMKFVLIGVAVFVMAILGLLTLVMMGAETGMKPLVIGMIAAILPVPIYIGICLWLDRFEAEPPIMLALAFLWGATVATFLSFILNTVFGAMIGASLGEKAGQFSMMVVCAPIFEELSKGIALLILFLWKRNEFDGIVDGVIYATMVALGFAMTENFLYYGRGFAQQGTQGLTVLFIIRGVMAPFSHPLFTSMIGIGLGLSLQTTYKSVKFLAPIGGFIAAIFFHFMWNLSASFGEAFFVVYLVMMMPALVCVLLLIYFSLRREGRIVREHLFIEFQSGRISQVDYECVTNAWRRMGASRRAFFKGLTPWRTRRKFHQLASELAFHRDRINRGVCKRTQETDAIEYAYVEQIVYIVGPPMQASNTPPPIPRR